MAANTSIETMLASLPPTRETLDRLKHLREIVAAGQGIADTKIQRWRDNPIYIPRELFRPYHARKQRMAVIVAHRRAGKTVACLNDVIDSAVTEAKPDGQYAYIGPQLNQVKDIAWKYLKRYAAPILARPALETELKVQLLGGPEIRLFGADNPDRIRGLYLDGVVIDEYALMDPDLWKAVIRPLLADREGWATFIATPKGKNAFWEIYEAAKRDGFSQEEWQALNPEERKQRVLTPERWFHMMAKASQTGLISASELSENLRDMGPDLYSQEFECSFESALTGAYYAEELRTMSAEGRICHIDIMKEARVFTSWDIGFDDCTAIWFVQCVGRERRLIDYFEASGHKADYYADILHQKRIENGYRYGGHYGPHDAANHELTSGESFKSVLGNHGIELTIVPQHNPLDGINATRRMLDRTWINETNCARGLEALRQYRREWDDRLKTWKKTARHDWSSHGADSLRCFAAGFDDPAAIEDSASRLRRSIPSSGASHWSS